MSYGEVKPHGSVMDSIKLEWHSGPMPGPDDPVAQRVRLLRGVLRMNQAAFAVHLGVPPQRLNNVETGTQPLARELAFIIRAETGATTDWLWFGDARGLPYQLARDLEEAAEKARTPRSA